ncbi:zf-HC2 domain-containing protein [Actinophytocola sp. NPDC049390]|uniref:zf-HC2 domain-containing protein n=1 Tax=Actinophytocola sp. NPDC049390 TaxID=3363894 RepID=UPI0037AABEAC
MHCPHITTSACYLLGALSNGERQEFYRHAADCAECRQGIDDLLPVVLVLWRTRALLGGPDEDDHWPT